MARRQCHLIDQCRVPGRDDQPSRIGIGANHLQQLGDLVDRLAIGRRPAAPLVAVDRAEVAVLVGPFIPDRHAVFLQVADVGLTFEEPQQLVDDRAQVAFLRRDQRKTLGQIEAHLVAEDAVGASAGAVALVSAVFTHMPHQVEVLFHRRLVEWKRANGKRPGRACRVGRTVRQSPSADYAGRPRPSGPRRLGSSARRAAAPWSASRTPGSPAAGRAPGRTRR